MTMVGSWELSPLPIPSRFFRFARAYLDAAIVLNTRLFDGSDDQTYPRACVPLYLAQHAIELFLKGAILSRAPAEKLQHGVERLGIRYHDLYSEICFRWDIPFGTAEPVGAEPGKIEELRKLSLPADQQFRYPTDIEKKPWMGISAYLAAEFHLTLNQVSSDFDRLESLILAANPALNTDAVHPPRAG
jgi:hypothetical protein